MNAPPQTWAPVSESERYPTLDVVCGMALFGVLLVNLLGFFRVSLFHHILTGHTHEGYVNRAVNMFVAAFLEFKAFDLFSITFGMSVALQAGWAALRGIRVHRLLMRRLLVLFVFGLCHMFLIANLDILALYAVCGLFGKLGPALAVLIGVTLYIYRAAVPKRSLAAPLPIRPSLPLSDLRSQAADAARAHFTGSLNRIRLPNGSVTSMHLAFHGASSIPGRKYG